MPLTNLAAFKLGSALGIGASPKSLPVRRPTALTVIANYGERFQRDIEMEANTPTLRLGNMNFVFSDHEWHQTSTEEEAADRNPNISVAIRDRSQTTQVPRTANDISASSDRSIIKNEAMMDMLSEVVAEMRLQEHPEKEQ
ncbi:protein chibby homolog 1-like isoform X2 [Paramacrobiotus metropolitanus]|uniref:protein chibby homolog 1-like isoform X2 n=1 Tax=Paramacrobiotus metropolitanus TaxID=2943436 RepID=UPI0024464323|nr:protein chibby homolog 1-like isoform X2 [Paramacrobiotus metropolitanus]